MTVIRVYKFNKKRFIIYILGFILLLILSFSMRKVIHDPKYNYNLTNDNEVSFVLEEGVILPDKDFLNEKELNKINISAQLKGTQPQILITHTHISEDYQGGGTVKEAGDALAEIFAKDYGITVVHDINVYDVLDGVNNVEGAYERMEKSVLEILEKYPSIEVIVDLHRDYVADKEKMVAYIDGNYFAPLMLVNGITTGENSPKNPFLQENLALSLKIFNIAQEDYKGLFRKIYIKPYRYSTHMLPLSILVEAGFQNNTLQEVIDSMKPLADTLVNAIEYN